MLIQTHIYKDRQTNKETDNYKKTKQNNNNRQLKKKD